jgi:EAL domain-containing protein (putative c-di-GMP-specific phosphodiesterase class I)/AmiR/NasT family two-component response regulator
VLARFADASVVVVDDVDTNVVLLDRLLTRAGLRNLHLYSDPREAMARLGDDRPDLVLADLHMPHLDGYAVLEHVARHAGGSYLPVLVLTADSRPESLRRALEEGARDFLTKPFDAGEVALRVRNLLETRFLHRALRENNVMLLQQVEWFRRGREEEAAAAREARDRVARVLAERAVRTVFQPVVDLSTGTVAGVEALSRFDAEPARGPHLWFAEAAEAGLGVALEVLAVERALEALGDLPEPMFLAVNVSPTALLSPDLRASCSADAARRLVLELTEHVPVEDYEALTRAVAPYRAAGARLAVDDAGAGHAGFRHLVGLAPDVVKMDMSITRRIQSVAAQRALASALVHFTDETGTRLLAEGIEDAGELDTLRGLGVGWGQGYLLARPQPLPEALAAAHV